MSDRDGNQPPTSDEMRALYHKRQRDLMPDWAKAKHPGKHGAGDWQGASVAMQELRIKLFGHKPVEREGETA